MNENSNRIEKVHSRRLTRILSQYKIEKLREKRTFQREAPVKRFKRQFRKFLTRFEMMQVLY